MKHAEAMANKATVAGIVRMTLKKLHSHKKAE